MTLKERFIVGFVCLLFLIPGLIGLKYSEIWWEYLLYGTIFGMGLSGWVHNWLEA